MHVYYYRERTHLRASRVRTYYCKGAASEAVAIQ
jgi:hypothetical protein